MRLLCWSMCPLPHPTDRPPSYFQWHFPHRKRTSLNECTLPCDVMSCIKTRSALRPSMAIVVLQVSIVAWLSATSPARGVLFTCTEEPQEHARRCRTWHALQPFTCNNVVSRITTTTAPGGDIFSGAHYACNYYMYAIVIFDMEERFIAV